MRSPDAATGAGDAEKQEKPDLSWMADQCKAMEKKLKAYYQTLVEPAGKDGYQHDKETMLDGTDVDAQIRKKRAH